MAAASVVAFEQLAQARAFRKIAGFHHHQGIAGVLRTLQKFLEQIGQIVAGAAHPHHAAPAHHGDRRGFIRQPRRIGQQDAFTQIRDIERIGKIGDHAFEQFLGALLHQTRVGTEHQRHPQILWRIGGKPLGVLGFDDHRRPLKKTPRSMRMRSAISSAARRSESCCTAKVA